MEETIWSEISQTLGFEDDVKTMLESLYLEKGWSIAKISSKIGISHTAVRRKIFECNISLRKRGGPNHTGTSKRLLDRFDLDFVMKGDVKEIATLANVDPTTVRLYRRRRREKDATTETAEQQTTSQAMLDFSHQLFGDLCSSQQPSSDPSPHSEEKQGISEFLPADGGEG